MPGVEPRPLACKACTQSASLEHLTGSGRKGLIRLPAFAFPLGQVLSKHSEATPGTRVTSISYGEKKALNNQKATPPH